MVVALGCETILLQIVMILSHNHRDRVVTVIDQVVEVDIEYRYLVAISFPGRSVEISIVVLSRRVYVTNVLVVYPVFWVILTIHVHSVWVVVVRVVLVSLREMLSCSVRLQQLVWV